MVPQITPFAPVSVMLALHYKTQLFQGILKIDVYDHDPFFKIYIGGNKWHWAWEIQTVGEYLETDEHTVAWSFHGMCGQFIGVRLHSVECRARQVCAT